MSVHVCTGGESTYRRVRAKCPTCKRVRWMASRDQEWYGPTDICMGCGEMWTEGEMHERPFRPGWRNDNKCTAREWWRRATRKAERR